MNERIQLLARQATDFVSHIPCVIDAEEAKTIYTIKFAQLIAADCADICMELAAKCAGLPSDGALAVDCANLIKQDFEIEL